ncbi:MAG: GNAT family acetyltransferase [Anaerolineae bacterium]|jgi:ribosomal protein S18 acetylase RimI-like enzyme|nr:GNAT family acetyltransferase [Anaerolineae bacterium]MBT4309590.1 GNAT family acetyltransferase [Anaerolineae bacterium]MBT4458807.1 GNAT family acetyltransferase [Anaerolineae bacterium]MBT4842676.1 GNAT family acetyltransferase [Anaerolineae bacterium]MBT6059956.1 GNAT family acetyltransferase [Anaerolineae bacterium]
MKIIPYEEKYQDQIVKLWQACGLTVPWNDPVKDITRKLAKDPELFLVGLIDEVLVASVMGGYEGHRGWINYLAVSPDLQKSGYGRQLMKAVEKKIAEQGAPKINLQIRTSNVDVIAFYKAIGYKRDDVVGMGKRLIDDE